MPDIYVGTPADKGRQPAVTLVTAEDSVLAELTPEERAWCTALWFKVMNSNQGFRRDVCVYGHFLRIVLRAAPPTVPQFWDVWAGAMDDKGETLTHERYDPVLHGRRREAYSPTAFRLMVRAPTQFAAMMKFYHLFEPGPRMSL